ncbi:hypothetical protein LMG29542_07542 [Paraburkholderia humisilvae]|uniref:Uncharacterized protein n=1 Tax=Paraburkholderia humisilvae TaxID=627669 RepID=A0A6J5F913_9BURK|nr:hypothetical protein LMG29542_07542 [Paraburkholderia humisilvae]
MRYVICCTQDGNSYNWGSATSVNSYIMSISIAAKFPSAGNTECWSFSHAPADKAQILISIRDLPTPISYVESEGALKLDTPSKATKFLLLNAGSSAYYMQTPDKKYVNVNTSSLINKLVVGENPITQWTFGVV